MGKVNPRFIDPLLDVILGILPWAMTFPKPSHWCWLDRLWVLVKLTSLSAYLGGNDEEKFTPSCFLFFTSLGKSQNLMASAFRTFATPLEVIENKLFELQGEKELHLHRCWPARVVAIPHCLLCFTAGVIHFWGMPGSLFQLQLLAVRSHPTWPRHPWWEGTLPSTSLLRLGPD